MNSKLSLGYIVRPCLRGEIKRNRLVLDCRVQFVGDILAEAWPRVDQDHIEPWAICRERKLMRKTGQKWFSSSLECTWSQAVRRASGTGLVPFFVAATEYLTEASKEGSKGLFQLTVSGVQSIGEGTSWQQEQNARNNERVCSPAFSAPFLFAFSLSTRSALRSVRYFSLLS